MKLLKRNWPIVGLILFALVFFHPFITKGKLPIPADTIIGLYHPFRDLYANEYPRGIPFKNFLITDPVRQQYPWRELSISLMKRYELPLWNPYSFAGTPLLANMQSAPFYPLNLLFFTAPFPYTWSILILLQPILGALFLYLYLRHVGLNKFAGFLGALVFAFSGFSIVWLEWNTIVHVGLWLPLIFLSIDKVFFQQTTENSKRKIQNHLWPAIFIFSLSSSFFAGHLQMFFYVFLVSLLYLILRWIQYGRNKKLFLLFTIYYLLFTLIIAVQWVPAIQFIVESARSVDQATWQQPGWFIPWQHLVQFVAPDFFGNPTTLNYWGEWNYAEFIGYVGIVPLILALFALFFRHDKKTLFFGTFFFLSLLFSLPTIFAKVPYLLSIPLLSTTQPTRLLFITDFTLSILAALGTDYLIKNSKNRKKIMYIIGFLGAVYIGLWAIVVFGPYIKISAENLLVAKRNLILPTTLFISSLILFLSLWMVQKNRTITIIYIIMVVVTIFDLLRFAEKFTPFTNREYLFPKTEALSFLQEQRGQFRIMTTDRRIFPPNFSIVYRLQSVDGYDPLYIRRYGELIAASERGEPDISPPFGFNRIITPHNYESKIIDLLGVKYILSLTDIASPKLTKVFQEGQTRVYENKNAFPRSFFVQSGRRVLNKEQAMKALFDERFEPLRDAVVEDRTTFHLKPMSVGRAVVTHYSENRVIIRTENKGDGFLVLTDSYYPTWRARIDGSATRILMTNYHLRGVFVPKGTHTVEFSNRLF